MQNQGHLPKFDAKTILFKLTDVEIYQNKLLVYGFTEIWSLVSNFIFDHFSM